MKRLVFAFAVAIRMSANAASVIWGAGLALSDAAVSDDTACYRLVLDLLWVSPPIDVYNFVDLTVKTGDSEDGKKLVGTTTDITRAICYVTATIGDVISKETTREDSRILVANDERHAHGNAHIDYPDNKSTVFYLGFEAEVGDSGEWPFDPITHTFVDDNLRIYGWVQLCANGTELTLGDTCIDLSGRPVTVGTRPAEPVPEPASGALALLGAALFLRRRKDGTADKGPWGTISHLPPARPSGRLAPCPTPPPSAKKSSS